MSKYAAEQAFLGIILIDPSHFHEARFLVPESSDFANKRHRLLYELMGDISKRGQEPETMVVAEAMLALPEDQVGEWGGDIGEAIAYVSSLPEYVPSTEALPHYAEIIRTRGVRRRVSEAGRRLHELSKTCVDPMELIVEAEKLLQSVAGSSIRQDWIHAPELIGDAWKEWQRRATIKGPTGIASGLYDLDHELGGWNQPNLIILAARPAMGKTAALLQFCGQACRDGVPTAILSEEMDQQQVLDRVASTWAEVPYTTIQRGRMDQEQWARLTEMASTASEWPLWVDDKPRKVTELRSTVRRLVCQHGIRMLAIDYLQIMTPEETKRGGKREEEVAMMARGLKSIAKEFKLAVVVAAQLNRGVELRKDKHPVLSDLRESGAIEQEADQVLGLCRPAYYEREATPAEQAVAHFDILKNRFGRSGHRIETQWDPQFQRFRSVEHRYDYDNGTPSQEIGYS